MIDEDGSVTQGSVWQKQGCVESKMSTTCLREERLAGRAWRGSPATGRSPPAAPEEAGRGPRATHATHLRNQSMVVVRRLRWPHTGPVNWYCLQLSGPARQDSASAMLYHSVWKQHEM